MNISCSQHLNKNKRFTMNCRNDGDGSW
jgi:hypothetical protein